jgi:hypothetical protein
MRGRRSSIAHGAALIEPNDSPYVSSSLTDKLRHPLQLRSESDMHANLTFTSSPDKTFYAQPSGPDPWDIFNLASGQLTPFSLHDSSETASIAVSAMFTSINLRQD